MHYLYRQGLCFIFVLGALVLSPRLSQSAEIVVNGIETTAFPAVQLLTFFHRGEKYVYHCSGTRIAPGVYLTAAHCVLKLNGELGELQDYEITDSESGHSIRPYSVQVNHAYQLNLNSRSAILQASSDLAVLFFHEPAPLRSEQIIAVNSVSNAPLAHGDSVTLIGYGRSLTDPDTGRDPVKKYGMNSIDYLFGGVVFYWGKSHSCPASGSTCVAGRSVSTQHGDSGGALIRNGQLIAVTSQLIGEGSFDHLGFMGNIAVDLTSDQSRAFLKAALAADPENSRHE